MTDTPRTEAELLTIFEDGQVGAISAQDMRDYVKSITQPVNGGALGAPLLTDFSSVASLRNDPPGLVTLPASSDASHFGAATLVPNHSSGPYNIYPADPQGWYSNSFTMSGSDPTSGWNLDIAAGDVVMLPTGAYVANTFLAVTDVTVDPGVPVGQVEFSQQTYDPDDHGVGSTTDPWVYSGFWGPLIVDQRTYRNVANTAVVGLGASVLLINDTVDPTPYAVIAYTKGFTSPVVVIFVQTQIMKVQ